MAPVELFVSSLSVALSIPGCVQAIQQLSTAWKPGITLQAPEVGEFSANLENLRTDLLGLFKVHYELARWKKLHDAFHSFISMTEQIDNEIMGKPRAASIDCPLVKQKWDEQTVQNFLDDLETSVFPSFQRMKKEELKEEAIFAEKIRDNYLNAVTAKNKTLLSIAAFMKVKKKFDEKIYVHLVDLDKQYDAKAVKTNWKALRRLAFQMVRNADNVLINLIEILGTAYSIAEGKLKK